MKKVSIIAPILNNVYRINENIVSLLALFKEKYDFEVIYFYNGSLPENTMSDSHFIFKQVPINYSFDDCVTLGFKEGIGDCVIVANLNDPDYKDYLIKLIVEWESKAQIVLISKRKKANTFWKKIGNFFCKINYKLYDFALNCANLNHDFKVYNTFQLFSREVANQINEFPHKNYFLRNFDCWVDYKVNIIYSSKSIKDVDKPKVMNGNFICFLSSFAMFLGFLLLVIFLSPKVKVEDKSMFILIGIGLMAGSLVFGLYHLFKWFVNRKTRLDYSLETGKTE